MSEKKDIQPNKQSPTRVLPVSALSASHVGALQGTWSDSKYCYQQMITFRPYSATGVADRISLMETILDQIADASTIKEWVAAERTAAAKLVLLAWELLVQLRMQKAIRMINGRYVKLSGSDTGTVWTIQGWDAIIPELEQSELPVPSFLIALAQTMVPMFAIYPELNEQSLTSSYLLPWSPYMTVAEVRTLGAVVIANMQGIIHFQKIGLKYEYFNRSMLTGMRLMPYYSCTEETLYWRTTHPIHYYNSAPTLVTRNTGFETNKTTGYTNKLYSFISNPWVLYGLQAWLEPYDSTNNKFGCLEFLTPSAASRWGVYTYTISGVRTELADSADSTLIMGILFPYQLRGITVCSPTLMTAGSGAYDDLVVSPITWCQAYSYSIAVAAASNTIVKLAIEEITAGVSYPAQSMPLNAAVSAANAIHTETPGKQGKPNSNGNKIKGGHNNKKNFRKGKQKGGKPNGKPKQKKGKGKGFKRDKPESD